MGGVFAGLAGKKLETMKKLIRGGHTLEEICEWMSVLPEFVAPFMAEHRFREEANNKPVEPIEIKDEDTPFEDKPIDPYAHQDLENVDLKEFRKWVQDNINPDLPKTSTRKIVIKEYMTRL